jgi:hypothetical protein
VGEELKNRVIGKSGHPILQLLAEISFSPAELEDIEKILPRGIAAGPRYPEMAMRFVQS